MPVALAPVRPGCCQNFINGLTQAGNFWEQAIIKKVASILVTDQFSRDIASKKLGFLHFLRNSRIGAHLLSPSHVNFVC
jgi:hypothetical protein